MRKRLHTAAAAMLLACLLPAAGVARQEPPEVRLLKLPGSPILLQLTPNKEQVWVINQSVSTVVGYLTKCVANDNDTVVVSGKKKSHVTKLQPSDPSKNLWYFEARILERDAEAYLCKESFSLTVTEVKFEDGVVWKADDHLITSTLPRR